MIRYRDFVNEGNIPKIDKETYKGMKYGIGDKVLFRVRRNGGEKIYLKEYFDKRLRKCDSPTQKRSPHTWNCKYCKGTGIRGYDEIFRELRPLLKDKEIKYQDSYENYFNDKPVWFNVDEYWYELDFGDVRRWRASGRLLVRPKEKKEREPNDENWWFVNSEKKPIKK